MEGKIWYYLGVNGGYANGKEMDSMRIYLILDDSTFSIEHAILAYD